MLNRRFFALLLMSIIALVLAPSVSAAQPIIFTFTNEYSFVRENLCDFPVQFDFVEHVRVIAHVDGDGNTTRVVIPVNFVGTLTNVETGKTVSDRGHFTIIRDVAAGTVTYVGLQYNLKVGGEQVAVRDIGRVVFDADGNVLFEAGPKDIVDGGRAAICPVLASS